jgi:hypothetical protein
MPSGRRVLHNLNRGEDHQIGECRQRLDALMEHPTLAASVGKAVESFPVWDRSCAGPMRFISAGDQAHLQLPTRMGAQLRTLSSKSRIACTKVLSGLG